MSRTRLLALAAAMMPILAAAAPQSFQPETLAAITARWCGKGPLAVAVWSVDCPYCKDGLAALEKVRRERRDVRLVLVQADPGEQAEEGQRLLERFGIAGSERWIFADVAPERLRYAIDREWAGEMPRAYLYDAECRRTAISGRVDAGALRTWLAGFPR